MYKGIIKEFYIILDDLWLFFWLGGVYSNFTGSQKWWWMRTNSLVSAGYQSWSTLLGPYDPPTAGFDCMVYVKTIPPYKPYWTAHPCSIARPFICE